ncbi:unnamed protein product, partial [Polarella glacialis]
ASFLFAAIAFCLVAARQAAGEASAVVVLTSADCEAKVGDGKGQPWVIKFYAPWCHHCMALVPVWEQLAEKYKGKVSVGTVDCIKDSWLGNLFDVDGYPTLKIITDGKMYTYDGSRTFDYLVKWIDGGYRSSMAEALPQHQMSHIRPVKAVGHFISKWGLYILIVATVAVP